jgi:branched-chain amino acid transport system permease protein
MLFPDLIRQFDEVTGGSSGYKVTSEQLYRGAIRERAIRWVAPSWTGLADDQWRYYVFLAVAIVCFVLVRNLVNSRTGRALVAIRDNEVAAEVNGVNVARVKVLSFGLSAALAGVGGALYALWATQLFPQSFLITASFYFLVAVVVGGPATILGPAIGALFYGFFYDIVRPELPERAESATPLILGILLIVLMRVAPGGVVGSARQLMARFAMTRGVAGGPPLVAEGWSTTDTALTDELGEGEFESVSGELFDERASDTEARAPDETEATELEHEE